MQFADTVKHLIRAVYAFSPYFWADTWLKSKEFAQPENSLERDGWRAKRLMLSERYIVYWFLGSMLLYGVSIYLPWWVALLLCFRVFGILNKELGVILFGICKITEGTKVSASGRVVLLGLVNYLTAMFLFATVYGLTASFQDIPAYTQTFVPLWPFIQAVSLQFTLSPAFIPDDLLTWMLCLYQSGFCFLFGTIVISMFVSLLNIKPLRE